MRSINHHSSKSILALVVLAGFGFLYIFMAMLLPLIAVVFLFVAPLTAPINTRPDPQMTAFSNWALAFWPFLLVIGVALLICTWKMNEGSSFARLAARVVILANVLGIGANAIYFYTAYQQFGPPVLLTMFPGMLGNVLQTGVLIGGALFWVGVTAFMWYLLGDDKRGEGEIRGKQRSQEPKIHKGG